MEKRERSIGFGKLILPILAVITFLYTQMGGIGKLPFSSQLSQISGEVLKFFHKITSQVHVPLGGILLLFIIIGIVGSILRLIAALLSRTKIGSAFFSLLNSVAFLWLAFFFLWGHNYLAPGYQNLYEKGKRLETPAKVETLAKKLLREAEESRQDTGLRPDEEFKLNRSVDALTKEALRGARGLSWVTVNELKAKEMLLPDLVQATGIIGAFNPFSGEIVYHPNQPDVLTMNTVLHEAAHFFGLAREGEASYGSYLLSETSPDAGVKYSGQLMALRHVMARLKELDPRIHEALKASYSLGIQRDIKAIEKYQKATEGLVQDTMDKINDGFLKSNGQSEGIESYHQLVFYLLASRE